MRTRINVKSSDHWPSDLARIPDSRILESYLYLILLNTVIRIEQIMSFFYSTKMHFNRHGESYQWSDEFIMNGSVNINDIDITDRPENFELNHLQFLPEIWKQEEFIVLNTSDRHLSLNRLFSTIRTKIDNSQVYPGNLMAILTLTKDKKLWLNFRLPDGYEEYSGFPRQIDPVLILDSVLDFNRSENLIVNTDEGLKLSLIGFALNTRFMTYFTIKLFLWELALSLLITLIIRL